MIPAAAVFSLFRAFFCLEDSVALHTATHGEGGGRVGAGGGERGGEGKEGGEGRRGGQGGGGSGGVGRGAFPKSIEC